MPQTVTREYTLYEFKELSDTAKETARQWWKEMDSSESWDLNTDSLKEIGGMLGIKIKDIWFTLFVQGAGSSFDGTYSYVPGALKKIMEECPTNEKLHQVARDLQDIQRKNFYQLSADVVSTDNHRWATTIEVSDNRSAFGLASDSAEEGLKEALRDFMTYCYNCLHEEAMYQTSDEYIDDALEINEYTFSENGNRLEV